MKTYLDCIPCFFRQVLEAVRLAGGDEDRQKKALDELAFFLPHISLESSPPEIGRDIYNLVRQITGQGDPFKSLKQKSNQLALKLYPELKKRVENSPDKILTAVRIAIAGNVIDYGVPNSFQLEEEIEKTFEQEFYIFDYEDFKAALKKADRILYLADNAGEVVFDRILIETIKENTPLESPEFVFAVREKPVINDALIEDALTAGLDKVAQVLSSGSEAPGTILKYCSQEFLEIYNQAELIISKGQGNFESLEGEKKTIFFLFKAKCLVIAKDIKCEVGDIILKKG